MPQLSPINWLFVYMFFWFMVSVFCVIMWWGKKMSYSMDLGKNNKLVELEEGLMWGW